MKSNTVIDRLDNELKGWDWKTQIYGKDGESITSILSRIDKGTYHTKKIKLDLSTFPLNTHSFNTEDLFDFMTHYKLVQNADLQYPVIMGRRSQVIDGRHRICKAILEGRKTIDAIMITNYDTDIN